METSTSPLPKDNFVPEPTQDAMDFHAAIDQILAGKKVHKLQWEDKEFYALLNGDQKLFSLHKPDGEIHQWVIGQADTVGNDWIVL